MASSWPFLAPLSRLCLRPSSQWRPQTYVGLVQSIQQTRDASKTARPAGKGQHTQKNKKKGEATKKKRKARVTYLAYDLKDMERFSLLDAMRYIRAVEVGRPPTSVKYEMALRLKSLKNGPVVRNRLRLPHPVKTDLRICVICPPDSKYAESARAAGATLVGEDDIFEAIKDGRIEFDRCLCQTDSLAKMNKAGMGRVLGPRGLMPNAKTGTVVKDPSLVIKEMVGGAEYKERLGVVRIAVGQLGFTPEEMQRNIKAFVESVKRDISQLSDRINKELAEVVLSSTNGPGFSLNGDFRNPASSITSRDLSTE